MIKANELRIGSRVLYPHTQEELFQITEPRQIELANILLPIPLSPEWLERCGFEDNGAYWEYNGEPGFVLLKDKEGAAYIGNPVRTYVKTVHHLQNLYFALTEGVELQIKMP